MARLKTKKKQIGGYYYWKAKLSHEAQYNDEVSIIIGDIIDSVKIPKGVLKKDWIIGRVLRTNETGLIPIEYVDRLEYNPTQNNINSLSLDYRKKFVDDIDNYIYNLNCTKISDLYNPDTKSKGLKLLGCGSNGCGLAGCLEDICNHSIVIKVSKIIADYHYNYAHPSNVENFFLKEFSDNFLLKNISPHYTFFYSSIDCNDKILDLIPYTQKQLYKSEIADGDIIDIFKIYAVEHSSNDLDKYLKTKRLNMKTWNIIFFQLCFMLSVTQYYYPGFRHNDLKLDNILVDIYKPNEKYIRYVIFGKEFLLPDIGIRLKMWDMDFAACDSIINSKVEHSWSDSFGCTPEHNPIYDLHTFLNFLITNDNMLKTHDVRQDIINLISTNDMSIKKMLKLKLVPKLKLIGFGGDYSYASNLLSYGRLNGSKFSKPNLIPIDMNSPSDLLYLDSKYTNNRFKEFEVDIDESDISVTFNSFIPKLNINEVESRTDMFNITSHPIAKKWELKYDPKDGYYYSKSDGSKTTKSIPLNKSNYI